MFFYFIFFIYFKVNIKYRTLIAKVLMCLLVVAGLFFSSDSVVISFYTDPIILEFVSGIFLG
jgi:ethanolamine transporter EutH